VADRIPTCRATFYPGEGHVDVFTNHMYEIFDQIRGPV
jgi:hypothetical protein